MHNGVFVPTCVHPGCCVSQSMSPRPAFFPEIPAPAKPSPKAQRHPSRAPSGRTLVLAYVLWKC